MSDDDDRYPEPSALVDVRAVLCPTCGAGPHEKCLSASGHGPQLAVHQSRYLAAGLPDPNAT